MLPSEEDLNSNREDENNANVADPEISNTNCLLLQLPSKE